MKKRNYVIIDHCSSFAAPDDYVEAESPMAAMMWWRSYYGDEKTIDHFEECDEGEERFKVQDLKTYRTTYYKPVLTKEWIEKNLKR